MEFDCICLLFYWRSHGVCRTYINRASIAFVCLFTSVLVSFVIALQVNSKDGAGKVDYEEDAADKAFWKFKGNRRDLSKLNTMRPKPTAPMVKHTNETTQKRISLNRRKTRMCV